VYFVC